MLDSITAVLAKFRPTPGLRRFVVVLPISKRCVLSNEERNAARVRDGFDLDGFTCRVYSVTQPYPSIILDVSYERSPVDDAHMRAHLEDVVRLFAAVLELEPNVAMTIGEVEGMWAPGENAGIAGLGLLV